MGMGEVSVFVYCQDEFHSEKSFNEACRAVQETVGGGDELLALHCMRGIVLGIVADELLHRNTIYSVWMGPEIII